MKQQLQSHISDNPTCAGAEKSFFCRHQFLLLFITIATIRAAFLFLAPITLSPDEAYFWDWSRHLDWGYCSKPPAISWIIALSTWIFGNTAVSVRIPALLMSLGSLLFIYFAGKRIFSTRTGFMAALFMGITPASAVSAFVMTIDAPLIFFWSMAIYSLWRAVEPSAEKKRKGTWWVATGIATGAGLLAKQTMVAFPAGALLFLLMTQEGRKAIRTKWPWIAALISIAALLPVAWWNYRHGWITLEHTAHHFERKDFSIIDSTATLFEFIGSQAGIYSPLLWILLVASGLLVSRELIVHNPFINGFGKECEKENEGLAATLLISIGFIMLIPVTLLSLRQQINANWPAPFYLAMVILTAGWSCGDFARFKKLAPPRPGFVKAAVYCASLFTIIMYLAIIVIPFTPISSSARNPLVQITGWDHLGQTAQEIYDALPSPEHTFIVTRTRQTASALAFYMPSHPTVYRWNGIERDITTQYEIWDAPLNRKGDSALIILDKDKKLPPDLAECFEAVQFIRSIFPDGKSTDARYFNVYLGTNMLHWTKR